LNIRLVDPAPIEIDPRPCERCGLKIDRHDMIDRGDGPLFFCIDPENLTLPELKLRADLRLEEHAEVLVEQWELADPRDNWKHTGAPRPSHDIRNGALQAPRSWTPYSPPGPVIAEFWEVIGRADPDAFKAWLLNHPQDAPGLLKLLEST
jgi:hypothetical protein